MKNVLLSFSFICLIIYVSQAKGQSTIECKLNKYKTKFYIPGNFKVLRNDDSVFIATDQSIYLNVYPSKGIRYEQSELISRLKELVDEKGLTIEGSYKNIYDLGGYYGSMVNGYTKGTPVFLMIIVDPDYNDISLLFMVTYSEDEVQIAKEILQSITPD